MQVSPRRFVKPNAPAVVAQREEAAALSQIRDFEVGVRVYVCSGRTLATARVSY